MQKKETTTSTPVATTARQTKKQLFLEICRFVLVGAIATLFDYAIFGLFDAWLFPLIMPMEQVFFQRLALVISTALGFCGGLVVNWLLSISFVFKAAKKQAEMRSKKAFGIFTLIGVFGLVITEVGMVVLVAILPQFPLFGSTVFLGTTWAKWLAKIIMTILVLIWNYIGRKKYIFNNGNF